MDEKAKSEIKRILVMKPYGGLGDLLLSTPVMNSLKTEFPGAHITAMVKEAFIDVVKGHPAVDETVGIPPKYTKGFAHFFEQLKQIKAGNYNMGLVLWTSAREAYLMLLAGIKYRVGQAGRLMYSFMFSHQVQRRSDVGDEDSHQVETLLDYVRALGIEPQNKSLDFFIPNKAFDYVDGLLSEIDVSSDDFFIGFNCTKGLPVTVQRWPVKKFTSFASALQKKFNAKVLFTGIPREREIVDAVMADLDGPFYSLAGKTDIKQAAALIERCSLFVSPDSGPMHIAAAVKTPVVGIYGLKGDYPKRWAPYDCAHRIVRLENIPCDDKCIKETCPRFKCYEAIPDEMVVSAAVELMKEAGR